MEKITEKLAVLSLNALKTLRHELKLEVAAVSDQVESWYHLVYKSDTGKEIVRTINEDTFNAINDAFEAIDESERGAFSLEVDFQMKRLSRPFNAVVECLILSDEEGNRYRIMSEGNIKNAQNEEDCKTVVVSQKLYDLTLSDPDYDYDIDNCITEPCARELEFLNRKLTVDEFLICLELEDGSIEEGDDFVTAIDSLRIVHEKLGTYNLDDAAYRFTLAHNPTSKKEKLKRAFPECHTEKLDDLTEMVWLRKEDRFGFTWSVQANGAMEETFDAKVLAGALKGALVYNDFSTRGYYVGGLETFFHQLFTDADIEKMTRAFVTENNRAKCQKFIDMGFNFDVLK